MKILGRAHKIAGLVLLAVVLLVLALGQLIVSLPHYLESEDGLPIVVELCLAALGAGLATAAAGVYLWRRAGVAPALLLGAAALDAIAAFIEVAAHGWAADNTPLLLAESLACVGGAGLLRTREIDAQQVLAQLQARARRFQGTDPVAREVRLGCFAVFWTGGGLLVAGLAGTLGGVEALDDDFGWPAVGVGALYLMLGALARLGSIPALGVAAVLTAGFALSSLVGIARTLAAGQIPLHLGGLPITIAFLWLMVRGLRARRATPRAAPVAESRPAHRAHPLTVRRATERPIDERAVADLVQHLDARPTEELLDIWQTNDREQWRTEAFEAIARVLGQRGVPLPEQVPSEVGPVQLVPEDDGPPGARSRRVLKAVSIASLVLGVLLLYPLVVTATIAARENEWAPLVGVAVAVVVFLGGGVLLRRRARRPGLDPVEALSLAGGFVAGVFGCVFLLVTVGFGVWELTAMSGIGSRAARSRFSPDSLLALGWLAATVPYIVALVLYARRRIMGASVVMIIGAVLTLPVGVLPIAVAIAARRAAQREAVRA